MYCVYIYIYMIKTLFQDGTNKTIYYTFVQSHFEASKFTLRGVHFSSLESINLAWLKGKSAPHRWDYVVLHWQFDQNVWIYGLLMRFFDHLLLPLLRTTMWNGPFGESSAQGLDLEMVRTKVKLPSCIHFMGLLSRGFGSKSSSLGWEVSQHDTFCGSIGTEFSAIPTWMMADFGEVKSSMLLSIPCIPYSVLTYPTIYYENSPDFTFMVFLHPWYTHDISHDIPMHKSCEKSMVPRPSKTVNRHPRLEAVAWRLALCGCPMLPSRPFCIRCQGSWLWKKNISWWMRSIYGWWFGKMTFIFPCIWNNHPSWLIFFRGFETTNQIWCS